MTGKYKKLRRVMDGNGTTRQCLFFVTFSYYTLLQVQPMTHKLVGGSNSASPKPPRVNINYLIFSHLLSLIYNYTSSKVYIFYTGIMHSIISYWT